MNIKKILIWSLGVVIFLLFWEKILLMLLVITGSLYIFEFA